MSPPLHAYSGRNFQVVMPSYFWMSNNEVAVNNIAVDFNDGTGYRTITMDQQINISYADTGTKTWTFRLTLSDNSVLYSHTEMQIEPEPNNYSSGGGSARILRPEGPIFLTADDAFNGEQGQGWITVDYANPAVNNIFRLVRPLIVVEGFDPGHLLTPENQFGISDFNSFLLELDGSANLQNLLQSNNQQYDIIYVDWARGTDFLQRNALLLERVIRWVNEQKAIDGSNEPNVILGQSMGGVISRWALRDMENRGLNHQTRLFISWDSPQQGANVPVAFQHLARHANSLFVQSVIPILFGGINVVRLARNGLNLIDVPAARQMLMNRVLNNGQIDNTDHDAWQLELRNLGYPLQSRNIAVSNGSECGAGQGFQPFAQLLNIDGRANTRLLSELALKTWTGLRVLYATSVLTQKPQFLLGIVTGRNDFFFELNCRAQPVNSTNQIYKGKITYRKKIAWLVNINTIITNRTRNSDPSVLAIDGTPGGMLDNDINLQNASFQNWAIKYNISSSSIPHFNFVPTTSALDIGGGNNTLTLADYQARYIGGTPPAAPLNTPFANFTTSFNQVNVSNGTINNNEDHIGISPRNGNWVAEELNGNENVRTNCNAFCENGTLTGSEFLCASETYTAPFGNGVNYAWSVDKPWLVTINPVGNTFEITRNQGAQGNLTITVQITGPCGPTTLTRTILLAFPETQNVTFESVSGTTNGRLCTDNRFNLFSIYTAGGSYPYEAQLLQWPSLTVVHTQSAYTGQNTLTYTPQPGWYVLEVRPLTNCGAGNWFSTEVEAVDCSMFSGRSEYFSITASPNPVREDLYVETNNEKQEVKILGKDENVQITLHDFYTKQIVGQWKFKNDQKQYKLNVKGRKKGMYVLLVSKGKYQQSRQIIIE